MDVADKTSTHIVREAARVFQQSLETRIEGSGIRRGHWHYLRALWEEDGLSQRELSKRVGTKEPTTAMALRVMENAKLIRRKRCKNDSRRAQVLLTPKAKKLREKMSAIAGDVVFDAELGIARDQLATFRNVAAIMIDNLSPKESS